MEVNNNQMPQYNKAQGIAVPQSTPVNQAATITPIKVGNSENYKKYSLLALIFGIAYSFCLFHNHSSITHPIFMVAALIILKLMRAKEGLSLIADCNGKKSLGIFYVVSLMLLSIHRCMTTSMALDFFERTAIVLLLLSYIVYLYVDTTGFDIGEWFAVIFGTLIKPFEHIARPVRDHRAYKKESGKEVNAEKKKTIVAVLIGIGIALFLLLIILPLLASADAVFENILSNIKFDIDDKVVYAIKMVLTAIIVFWASYTIITSLAAKEVKIKLMGEGTTNPVIAITFTSIIGAVYVLFCAIQFIYLFSGNVALPKNYTYAEYAHEGFYQLLAVCILNLVMVSICRAFFKESKVLKALLTIIAVCTYIMIASSAMRMILYIGAYHLTFLRLFVLWFLVVLSLWLAFLIASLYIKKFPVFRASMVVITVLFIAFIYSNPDYQIAKYDIAAAAAGDEDDWESVEYYITNNLSYDAIPAYVDNEELLNEFEGRYMWINNTVDEERYTGFRKFNFSYNYAKNYVHVEYE
ncbi:DUF4173 domain-containing protein [Butyrivibrio sp. X503]|uniref:DUF4153 domain-containing protein n=1 Tax=Butyrivibrio sp. X503 TaxID=2364878 RepID=UPI000EA9048C|nr:DUF4173 domain-containing protein [Butyrivibrio sp. X503]RKM56269.1 DUF4173 domain-containing protein [Butyrivibrio sp. X503]